MSISAWGDYGDVIGTGEIRPHFGPGTYDALGWKLKAHHMRPGDVPPDTLSKLSESERAGLNSGTWCFAVVEVTAVADFIALRAFSRWCGPVRLGTGTWGAQDLPDLKNDPVVAAKIDELRDVLAKNYKKVVGYLLGNVRGAQLCLEMAERHRVRQREEGKGVWDGIGD